MKKLTLSIGILAIITAACTEIIDIDLDTSDSKLIVY